MAGPDDRVVEPAGGDGLVGLALRAEVDVEDLVALVRRVGAHRADDHVAPRPGELRGLDHQDRAVAIERELALGAAPGAGAGGEDDRLGAGDAVGDVGGAVALEVADDGLGAGDREIAGLAGVADQAEHAVAAFGSAGAPA